MSVDREITEQFLNRMRKGVKILDTVTRPCTVEKTGEKSFRNHTDSGAEPADQEDV